MKRKNMLKRNSGFIIGCVVAAGVSFFAADVVMSDQVTLKLPSEEAATENDSERQLAPEMTEKHTYETDSFTVTADGTVVKGVETESPKQSEKETEQLQTDADGNVITPQTDENGSAITPQTDENGNVISSTDTGSGQEDTDWDTGSMDNSSGGSGENDSSNSNGGDTSWDDGSYENGAGNGSSSGGQAIEITDPGNGSYSYNGGSGNSGSSGSGNSGSGNSGSGSNSGNSSQSGGNGNGQGSAATPDDVILWGISSRYIDESELYNYSAGQLRLIRNEIFALHGRIFRSQDLRDYFSQKSWYVPTYDPDDFDANMFDYLNDYEAANLKVILNYETRRREHEGIQKSSDKITAPAACDWYFRRRCRVLSGKSPEHG